MSNPVSRYVSNVKKAASELSSARSEKSNAQFAKAREDVKGSSESTADYKKRMKSTDTTRSTQRVETAKKKVKEETGQFIGAVLQNRTYRNTGGITGSGAKQVNKVYRNMGK